MPSQDEIRKRNERLAMEREVERRRIRRIEEEKERQRLRKEEERRHLDKMAMDKINAKKQEEIARGELAAQKFIDEIEKKNNA